MLKIRAKQMGIFGAAALSAFEDRMIHLAMEKQPRLDEDSARDLVRHAIATGSENGIETEGPVAVLVELMAAFGRNLEMSPHRAWARTVLADRSKPGRLRAMLLRDRLTAGVQGRTIVPAQSEES